MKEDWRRLPSQQDRPGESYALLDALVRASHIEFCVQFVRQIQMLPDPLY